MLDPDVVAVKAQLDALMNERLRGRLSGSS
jgi:hypothetical protein